MIRCCVTHDIAVCSAYGKCRLMKPRYWSLAVVLILVNYLIFAALFTRLVETDFSSSRTTRTPVPTFTPAPAQPFVVVPTLEPVTPEPSPTPTRVLATPQSNAPSVIDESAQANASQPALKAQLVAPGAVNIRSGPGLGFAVIGTLNPNTTMPVIGRNADASWWKIEITSGTTGWVAASVVSASDTGSVPVAES